MPGSHSRLSPSSSHRWRRCPGSPNAEAGLPNRSGYEAAEGTVFHHFAALCLEFGFDPEVFLGKTYPAEYFEIVDGEYEERFEDIEFDGEMCDSMKEGLSFLEERMDEDCHIFVEKKVDLSRWLGPEEFGTSDCGIVDVLNRRITVFDWKYGMGVVSAKKNDQGILYALGFWATFAEELFDGDSTNIEVDIVIEQPRAPGGGGLWRTSMDWLLREGDKIKKEAAETKKPDAIRIPGEKQCQYCQRAKLGCDALDDSMQELLSEALEEMVEEPEKKGARIVRTVDSVKRTRILRNWPLIVRWKEGLHADAISDALAGRPVPDLKAVRGRSPPRKFRESQMDTVELKLAKLFGDSRYKKKLLSPTEVEKSLGKKRFEDSFAAFVTQGEPKTILVPLSDKRDPVKPLEELLDALEIENEELDELI